MPPPAKRDCGVIIFDVNTAEKDLFLRALIKIYTYKWLCMGKDTYKLLLANTKGSTNSKHFNNITDPEIDHLNPLSVLEVIENTEPEEGDWLDALLLAIHHLKDAFGTPGIYTLQILFITDLKGCSISNNEEKVKKIIKLLKEYNIYLYIIGPKVKLPYTITDADEIQDCMKEIALDETNTSLATAKKIISSTEHSVICDLKVGINLFDCYKEPRGRQPWKVPLSFGSKLEIPVITVKIYRKEQPFKLTLKKPPGSARFVLAEDEEVTVSWDELVSGVERHGKFVRVEERDMFKIEGPRSFAVVGFTDCHTIPEYYMRGDGSFLVMPDNEKHGACQFIYNLVDVLSDRKMYAIVRRVYNANNKPKFFVLIPQPDLEPKCFVMAELPYADDVKQNYSFKQPSVEMMETEDDDLVKFCSSIDIFNEKNKVDIPLTPNMKFDCNLNNIVNLVAKKHLERDFDFEDLEINELDQSETNEFMEDIKASWPKPSDSSIND